MRKSSHNREKIMIGRGEAKTDKVWSASRYGKGTTKSRGGRNHAFPRHTPSQLMHFAGGKVSASQCKKRQPKKKTEARPVKRYHG